MAMISLSSAGLIVIFLTMLLIMSMRCNKMTLLSWVQMDYWIIYTTVTFRLVYSLRLIIMVY